MKTVRTFLVLGAAVSNLESLKQFNQIPGVSLVIFDGNPNSVAKKMTDKFQVVDISNDEAVLTAAEKISPDGIYAMNDHGIRSAAVVSQKLGLIGLTASDALSAVDKGYMREAWESAGVNQPTFKVFNGLDGLTPILIEFGFPLIVKPADCGGGGRGVFVVNSVADIEEARKALAPHLSKSDRIIVEQFIEGTETSIEAVRVNNQSTILAWSKKVKAPGNSRVATLISYPGQFSDETLSQLKAQTELAMMALGIEEGIAHLEFIIDDKGKPWILELGARAGGGHTLHPITSHVSGLNYPELITRIYLGESPTIEPRFGKGACYAFFTSDKHGKVSDISGADFASKMSGVTNLEIWKPPGSSNYGLRDSMDRLGCIVALAESEAESLAVAQSVLDTVKFSINQSA